MQYSDQSVYTNTYVCTHALCFESYLDIYSEETWKCKSTVGYQYVILYMCNNQDNHIILIKAWERIYCTSIRKKCNFTVNLYHINKSKETRVVAYTCRYSSGPVIPNSATITVWNTTV